MKGGRRYNYNRKDEIIHGLSPSGKCERHDLSQSIQELRPGQGPIGEPSTSNRLMVDWLLGLSYFQRLGIAPIGALV